MANQSKTDAANNEFKKAQRLADGKKAMSEYEAEAAAVQAKTERLRAARLARDAALAANPPPVVAAPKKTAKKTKASAVKLSAWLDDQNKSGRSS